VADHGRGYEGGRWYVRSGELVTDHAPGLLHRLVRRGAGLVGVGLSPEHPYRLESVTATGVTLSDDDGVCRTLVRTAAAE
jgi:hypothetical protein